MPADFGFRLIISTLPDGYTTGWDDVRVLEVLQGSNVVEDRACSARHLASCSV